MPGKNAINQRFTSRTSVNGFLVEPDDIAAIAERLIALLSDAALAKRIGQQGRKRIEERFTWEKYVDRMLEDLREKKVVSASPVS